MTQNRHFSIAGLILMVGVCALYTPSLASDVPRVPQWGPDQFGGYASNQIIVEFPPGLSKAITQRLQKTGVSEKSKRTSLNDARQVVSQGLGTLMSQWGVTSIRPVFSFEFKNPELATRYGLDRMFVVEVPVGTDTPAMVHAFAAHPREITSAGLDIIGGVSQLIPDDPDFSLQWGMNNTGQIGGLFDADIDAPEAWNIETGFSNEVIIAIVDSGVDKDAFNGVLRFHPEFEGRMLPGHNTVNNQDEDAWGDECFHGTHVAGIAAAAGNNSIGVAGVSWGAKILPVDVLGAFCATNPINCQCTGSLTDLMEGITWAAQNGADIINISLQFYNLAAINVVQLEQVVNAAHDMGAVLVCAAGNNFGNRIAFPAKLENCLAVSATTKWDQLSTISNWGDELDLSAPGESIWSTWPNGSYATLSGTSMATPHVAGLAALMKSVAPKATNTDIEQILRNTAKDLGLTGWDNKFGYGRINAFDALLAISSLPQIIDSVPPEGAVDARWPHDPDGNNRIGWNSIDLTFPGDVSTLVPEDFRIRKFGGNDPAPAVFELIQIENNILRVVLDDFIEVGAWTQFEHIPSGTKVRIAHLPGDVNGNRISNIEDIFEIMASISGIASPREDWSIDLDHSGEVQPGDLHTLLNLLNGGGGFESYMGSFLPGLPPG